MHRLFGGGNKDKNVHKPNITEIIGSTEAQNDALQVKIKKLDAELQEYQRKLSQLRDGPGKNSLKQKAMNVLRQKKMYEARSNNLQNQLMNMEQAHLTTENMKNTLATVSAMKDTVKIMKQQHKDIKIDKIEALQDEMQEYMDLANDISEAIGQDSGYAVDVDEDELDAELEILGMQGDFAVTENNDLSYLTSTLDESALPTFIDETPNQEVPNAAVKESAS